MTESQQSDQTPIAALIYYLRVELCRMSRVELAEEIGVHRQTVYLWETAKTDPSEAHKLKLCSMFSQKPLCVGWLNQEHFDAPSAQRAKADFQAFMQKIAAR